MSNYEFNGEIDGKQVKVIVKTKKEKKQYFAKPKKFNVNTPHFIEKHNVLEVHADFADGNYFRVMQPSLIGRGTYNSGKNFTR